MSSGKEGDYKILILDPKTSELNFTSAKLYINSDNLIEKAVIDSNSGKSTISFTGYRLNQNITDSDFTYSPPKGIKVIDLR